MELVALGDNGRPVPADAATEAVGATTTEAGAEDAGPGIRAGAGDEAATPEDPGAGATVVNATCGTVITEVVTPALAL